MYFFTTTGTNEQTKYGDYMIFQGHSARPTSKVQGAPVPIYFSSLTSHCLKYLFCALFSNLSHNELSLPVLKGSTHLFPPGF